MERKIGLVILVKPSRCERTERSLRSLVNMRPVISFVFGILNTLISRTVIVSVTPITREEMI